MISVKEYLVYARAPFASASIIPVVFGAAVAWKTAEDFSAINFFLALTGMVFAHFGINLFNDLYDFRQGADQKNRFRTIFSGGSPFLVHGRVTQTRIVIMGLFSLAMAFICGLILAYRVDYGLGLVIYLMIAGFIGGFFYTTPPFKFVYRGWGEIFIFLCFGVLPVLGTYYVITYSLAWTPVFGSIPIGLLITNVLYINQFPDYESDKNSGKMTLVARLGTERARFLYLYLVIAAFISILVSPLFLAFSKYYIIGLFGLIPAFIAALILLDRHQDPVRLFRGQALTIVAHIATGLLLTLGVLL